tara:strand:- start:2149 stop:2415 length:267 start_codon:yes stop_codon:yes gene_type:complete
MFVRPEQVAAVAAQHPQAVRARLVVFRAGNRDHMAPHCAVTETADTNVSVAITQSVSDLTKLRADIVLVEPGSLANDGKVIDDTRPVE